MAGSGGAGEVYKVEHTITKRVEALKVLLRDQADIQEQTQRFIREIQVQASLSHPNIASVLTAFRSGNELMMVMEWVDGRPLSAIIEKRRLTREDALDYARQAISALAYAHRHGVIHRDVKPSNMIISDAGILKLTDFGLARTVAETRITNTGSVVGSLHYISPEQIRYENETDHRSDIYSMGAVLYELVTGRRLFRSDNAFELMLAHVQEKPVPPNEIDPAIPRRLSSAILKALAKNPAQRFQSAEAFLSELEGFEGVTIPAIQPLQPFGRAVWAGAAITLIVLIGAAAGVKTWVNRNLADVPKLELRSPRPPGVPESDERSGPPREVIAVEVNAATHGSGQ